MGLFESVQLELFELMGYKKRASKPPCPYKLPNESPKQSTEETKSLNSFENLPFPVELARKKNLRGLRFRVTTKALLEISANQSVSEPEILSLITPHLKWIESQIQISKERHLKHPQKKWQSGERFMWNGTPLEMMFSPSSTKKAHIRFMERSFEYFYPLHWHKLSNKELQEKLHSTFLYFFKLKASEVLNERVDFWSKKMMLFPKSVAYRNQKTRWGSCSSEGKINLNWKLAVFNSEIQNYVVIHELAHLRHQDHSKNFWNLVEQFSPNRKQISKELQESAFEVDAFASESELYDANPGLI